MDINKEQRQKTETAEMKFLRNSVVYALEDQIRNNLHIFNLNNRIQNNSLNWIHYMESLDPECIPKQLKDYMPKGTRPIGHLKLCGKEEPIL
jgi:hypothetical protein